MLIELGDQFKSSLFANTSLRCQAIKSHGSNIIE